jgi:hypothetical protein
MLITPSGTGKGVGTGVGLGVGVNVAVGEGAVAGDAASIVGVSLVVALAEGNGTSVGELAGCGCPPHATRELPNSTISETTNSDFVIHSYRVRGLFHAGPVLIGLYHSDMATTMICGIPLVKSHSLSHPRPAPAHGARDCVCGTMRRWR